MPRACRQRADDTTLRMQPWSPGKLRMGAVTSPIQCADLYLAPCLCFQLSKLGEASADTPELLIIRFSPQLLHVWEANLTESDLDSKGGRRKSPS